MGSKLGLQATIRLMQAQTAREERETELGRLPTSGPSQVGHWPLAPRLLSLKAEKSGEMGCPRCSTKFPKGSPVIAALASARIFHAGGLPRRLVTALWLSPCRESPMRCA